MSSLFAKKLTQQEMEDLILTKKEWIAASCLVTQIWLFGSGHRKTMTEASDLDLVLVFQTEEEMNKAKISLAMNRPPHDWPHDLIFCTKAHFDKQSLIFGSIYHEAITFGENIFERE